MGALRLAELCLPMEVRNEHGPFGDRLFWSLRGDTCSFPDVNFLLCA